MIAVRRVELGGRLGIYANSAVMYGRFGCVRIFAGEVTVQCYSGFQKSDSGEIHQIRVLKTRPNHNPVHKYPDMPETALCDSILCVHSKSAIRFGDAHRNLELVAELVRRVKALKPTANPTKPNQNSSDLAHIVRLTNACKVTFYNVNTFRVDILPRNIDCENFCESRRCI